MQNKAQRFVSIPSELSLTLGISASKLWCRVPKDGSVCRRQFFRYIFLRIEFHGGVARCTMFVQRKLYNIDKSRFVYHFVFP